MSQYLKASITVLFFIGLVLIVHSCKKEELPILSTSTLSNITATSAFSGGNITSDGGASVIEKGVCWSLNEDPTTSDSRTVDGNGIGQFTSSISGLIAGSTYHARAYATNSVGTAYGADLSFSTLGKAPECITLPATNTTTSGTTLNGTVNANYLSTTVSFEYGTTISYGQTVNPEQNQITGNSFTSVLADINGLTPGTIYHFRVKTMNSLGVVFGNDLTFTTAVIPLYVTSAVENSTPAILEMTYNTTLASNKVPPASAFSVRVNSVARTVNTVTISGAKVWLNLASPVASGDVVTITYTKPESNPLQTPAGGEATNLSVQTVTNRVSSFSVVPGVNPLYVGSSVENETSAKIEIVYNMALSNILPAVSAFTVRVNSNLRSISAVAISGSSVILTLGSAVIFGDVVTVSYTKPATNALQSITGLQVATMSAQAVTNKVSSVGLIYVSSSVENSTTNIIEITYNEILGNSIPSTSAFIVMVNGIQRTITSVAISGKKVMLTLANPVVYGDIITVSYIKPAINPLIKDTGETAASFSSPQRVTNNIMP